VGEAIPFTVTGIASSGCALLATLAPGVIFELLGNSWQIMQVLV